MGEIQLYTVNNFMGGRNTREARNLIQPNQSPDDLNMQWSRLGSLTRRDGIQLHVPQTFGTDACYGLTRFLLSNEDRYLIAVFGTTLHAWKGSKPYTDKYELKVDLVASIERHFAQLNDNLYMSYYNPTGWNTTDYPIRWDGSYVTKFGHAIYGTDGTNFIGGAPSGLAALGTAGTDRMVLTLTNNYGYMIVNDYGPLGIGHSGAYTDFSTNSINYINSGVVSATPPDGKITLTLDPASADPRAVRLQIYRTLSREITDMSAPTFYWIGTIDKDDTSYVDHKNDSEIDLPYPGDTFFHRGYPMHFRYTAVHKNRMFFARVNAREIDPVAPGYDMYLDHEYPSRLYCSDAYQPDRVTFFTEVGSDRDVITQIKSFNNTLVIFKQNSIYALYGVGPSEFQVRQINPSIGCVAPRSVHILDNLLCFLGSDGMYSYDGNMFRRISEAIRPDVEGKSDARLELTTAEAADGRSFYSVPKEES
jgi:hypothetical protein